VQDTSDLAFHHLAEIIGKEGITQLCNGTTDSYKFFLIDDPSLKYDNTNNPDVWAVLYKWMPDSWTGSKLSIVLKGEISGELIAVINRSLLSEGFEVIDHPTISKHTIHIRTEEALNVILTGKLDNLLGMLFSTALAGYKEKVNHENSITHSK
jgi:hypothetical protein